MKPSQLIDKYIADLKDWRGIMLTQIRRIIHEADPEMTEEWKYMGSPVWYHNGQIMLAKAFKDKVKLTFPQGALIPDPDRLFNNGLEGGRWRAIDLHEGDRLKERTLKNLIRAAVARNGAVDKAKTTPEAHGIGTRMLKYQ